MSSADPASVRPARIPYLDWIRALGAIAVVLLHAEVTSGAVEELAAANPLAFAIEDALLVPLARWAVPVFFMVSGALMLDPAREMGWRKIGRHVWRIVFVLLTIGLGFNLVEQYASAGTFALEQVGGAVLGLARGQSWDHLWFLFELIGLYAITPVIRPWVERASGRELGATIAVLWLLLCVIPMVNDLTGLELYGWVKLSYAVPYYLAGWFCRRYLDLDARVCAVGIVSIVAATVLTRSGIPNADGAQFPEWAFMLPYSMFVFCAVKRFAPSELPRWAQVIASYSFGIYVLHPVFNHVLVRVVDVATWPLALVQVALVAGGVLLSVALTWVLRHIPVFANKL